MQISVELWDGRSVTRDVEASATIDAIKTKIQDEFGQGRLHIYGRNPCFKYDFQKSDTIDQVKATIQDEEGDPTDMNVVFSYAEGVFHVALNIALLSGRTITLDVSRFEIVYDIKTTIASEAGVPVDQQRLLYGERELHNGHRLSDYNVPDETTLQLVRGPPRRRADDPDAWSSDGEDLDV